MTSSNNNSIQLYIRLKKELADWYWPNYESIQVLHKIQPGLYSWAINHSTDMRHNGISVNKNYWKPSIMGSHLRLNQILQFTVKQKSLSTLVALVYFLWPLGMNFMRVLNRCVDSDLRGLYFDQLNANPIKPIHKKCLVQYYNNKNIIIQYAIYVHYRIQRLNK